MRRFEIGGSHALATGGVAASGGLGATAATVATAPTAGANYNVRVSRQPEESARVVSNGSGVVGATDVSDGQ